ncbi:Scr1 family TA system antitoxin-like transcriptional regulator [Micromonospora sp. NPDC047557]|uniref:DUF5753 domain-containing protein n=1 Tax=Micromonospora sp. NPDC047557 TaxID=3364250 RepID=UPI00371A42C9
MTQRNIYTSESCRSRCCPASGRDTPRPGPVATRPPPAALPTPVARPARSSAPRPSSWSTTTAPRERQKLLVREVPPHCVFLVDEAGLRRPVGGPAVLDAQLGRLQEVADLPFVRLHVIPLAVGEHVGLGGGFVLADLPDRDRALYLENAVRGHVMDDPEMIALIDRKWDSLLGEALSTGASLDLIRKLKVTQ